MEDGVKIVSSELLTPSRNLDNAPKFKLTAFDRTMRFVPYQQRVLFYKSLGGTPYPEIIKLLKKSLAEVLVVFYPLAGRIRVVEGVSAPALELDCGLGQSVRFTEAVTDAALDELGEFEPSEFCNMLCDLGSPPPEYPWTPEYPLLFIQVTKFSCGGISIGFGFSHQAVDGVSAWQFMISWAEMARKGSLEVAPEIKYDFAEEQHIAAITAAIASAQVDQGPLQEVTTSEKEEEQLVTKQYKLDRETIDKLKSEAAAATNGRNFSTFVVVSAYFWRKITLARGLPASSQSNFVFLVNCRGRFSSLSKTYFGNAIVGSQATVDVSDLKEDEGFSHCAAVLQKSIAAFSNETAIHTTAYLNWLVGSQKKKDEHRLSDSNRIQAIGSPRHPVYESDFGFGKPAGVTFGTNDLDDGKLYLFPSALGNGSVTVTVVLKPENMQRLIKLESGESPCEI